MTEKKAEKEIIILRETIAECVVSNLTTYGGLVAVIGLGVWVGSAAMQWAGFVIFAVVFSGKLIQFGKNQVVYNIAGARKRLDELEKEIRP